MLPPSPEPTRITAFKPQDSLNDFLGLGRCAWREARATLTRLLSSSEGALRDNMLLRERAILPMVRRQCGPACPVL